MAADDDAVARALLRQGPRALDEATYEEHARAIFQQFGVAIDDTCLLRLASREADAACEHVDALRRIAKDYVALLVQHRAERRRFLDKRPPGMPRSYAEAAKIVEAQHSDGHAPFRATFAHLLDMRFPPFLYWDASSFTLRGADGDRKLYRLVSEAIRVDVQRQSVEDEEDRLLTLLRQIPDDRETRRKHKADTPLIRVAREVATWTKKAGSTGRADWQATVRILEWHGWTLSGDTLSEKAQRLEDRVTRARRRQAKGTEPPER